MRTASTDDDLDILDFANMDPPTFITNVAGTLVLTPAACFTGQVEAWASGDPISRRDLFLAVGNCHLAEVQLQRLHPEGKQYVLDHVPETLPAENPTLYARTISIAIKAAPPPPKKADEPAPAPKRTRQELEGYRRCLLVRAAAYGGNIHDVPVVALTLGAIATRTPTEPRKDQQS